jgi:hypothetical protein
MITPKEAATLVDWPNPNRRAEIHDFVLNASARDIQLFVHLIATDTTDAREWRGRANMALSVRLAEDAEKTAQKLVTGTDRLITETETLVRFTRRLYILTIVLIALGSFEIFKFLLGLLRHNVQQP